MGLRLLKKPAVSQRQYATNRSDVTGSVAETEGTLITLSTRKLCGKIFYRESDGERGESQLDGCE